MRLGFLLSFNKSIGLSKAWDWVGLYSQGCARWISAKPPNEVSRYFLFISLPVWYMVAITLSSEIKDLLLRFSAMRDALIAFIAPIAFRSIHGTCTKPPIGWHVIPNEQSSLPYQSYKPNQSCLQTSLHWYKLHDLLLSHKAIMSNGTIELMCHPVFCQWRTEITI